MRVLTNRFALGALVLGSVCLLADTAEAGPFRNRGARGARGVGYAAAAPCCDTGYAGAPVGGIGYAQPMLAPQIGVGQVQPAYYPSATYGYANPCCPQTAAIAYGGSTFRYGYGATMYFPSPGYAQPMPSAGGIYQAGYPQPHHSGAVTAGGIVPGQLPTRPSDGSSGDTAAVESKAVKILDGSFESADLEVKVGTTVKWTNDGKKPHTVTSDKGDWGSGELANGQTFTATFTKAGTFDYHCKLHPDMKAKITVR